MMIKFSEGDDHVIVDENQLPFKLLGNLGCGHSGNVEKVEDVLSGKVYARKKMAIRARRAKAETERVFWNEIKIIRGFEKHHHIIRVFATYMAKREVGLLLEPVADEGDLGRFLEHIEEIRLDNPFDQRLEQLMPMLSQAFGCLASGLEFMHRKRIRHKDIKPQNILVHQGSMIYTDFGYSLDWATFSNSTTEGRPDCLTRRYCAPEVHDSGERNSSSDIFSLGCVYLEILATILDNADLVPDAETYALTIEKIISKLQSMRVSAPWILVQDTIEAMTLRDRKTRRNAKQVGEVFTKHQYLCCQYCWTVGTTNETGRKLAALVLEDVPLNALSVDIALVQKKLQPPDPEKHVLRSEVSALLPIDRAGIGGTKRTWSRARIPSTSAGSTRETVEEIAADKQVFDDETAKKRSFPAWYSPEEMPAKTRSIKYKDVKNIKHVSWTQPRVARGKNKFPALEEDSTPMGLFWSTQRQTWVRPKWNAERCGYRFSSWNEDTGEWIPRDYSQHGTIQGTSQSQLSDSNYLEPYNSSQKSDYNVDKRVRTIQVEFVRAQKTGFK